jgi:hypothetical protein
MFDKTISRLIAIITTSLLSACASSSTGIVSMGRDTYMISKEQGSGFSGLGSMKGEIITEAVQFCNKQGKEFQLTSSKETQPPYILGNYPRSEIEFMCLNAGDKRLQNSSINKIQAK